VLGIYEEHEEIFCNNKMQMQLNSTWLLLLLLSEDGKRWQEMASS
jgi:hypothetical protein